MVKPKKRVKEKAKEEAEKEKIEIDPSELMASKKNLSNLVTLLAFTLLLFSFQIFIHSDSSIFIASLFFACITFAIIWGISNGKSWSYTAGRCLGVYLIIESLFVITVFFLVGNPSLGDIATNLTTIILGLAIERYSKKYRAYIKELKPGARQVADPQTTLFESLHTLQYESIIIILITSLTFFITLALPDGNDLPLLTILFSSYLIFSILVASKRIKLQTAIMVGLAITAIIFRVYPVLPGQGIAPGHLLSMDDPYRGSVYSW